MILAAPATERQLLSSSSLPRRFAVRPRPRRPPLGRSIFWRNFGGGRGGGVGGVGVLADLTDDGKVFIQVYLRTHSGV